MVKSSETLCKGPFSPMLTPACEPLRWIVALETVKLSNYCSAMNISKKRSFPDNWLRLFLQPLLCLSNFRNRFRQFEVVLNSDIEPVFCQKRLQVRVRYA